MLVRNLTTKRKVLRSADGDTVLIMPRSTAPIDEKFNWQVNPKHFTVMKPKEQLERKAPLAEPAMPVTPHKGEQGTTLESLQTSRGNGSGVAKSTTVRA